jgi:hypothetical protein
MIMLVMQCQARAAGALYNLLVPKMGEDGPALAKFKVLLTDTMCLGMIRSCLEDAELEDDDDPPRPAGALP